MADANCICSSYESQQGNFEVVLPKSRVEALPTDSTVESIAEFILDEVVADYPSDPIEVHAF